MRTRIAILACSALLGACSSIVPSPGPGQAGSRVPGSELVGQTLKLQTKAGQASMMHFAPNGVVRAEFAGRSTTGNWVANSSQLCFSWGGTSRECWPYTAPFRRGQTVTVTSDRGNVVNVTLQ
jgi:hypothetical protein